jgi:hypothetical protein
MTVTKILTYKMITETTVGAVYMITLGQRKTDSIVSLLIVSQFMF